MTVEAPGSGELDEQIEVQAGRRAPFTQVGDWVLISCVSDRAVALYSRLAMHVNVSRGDTEVWPAQEVLAEWAGLSKPDSVTPYLDELAAIGAITVERMQYAGGLRTRNRYTIHQTPPPEYVGPIALADYYRMRREHPNELERWRAERREWIAAQVKVIAERRKSAGKSTAIEARPRTPLERGTERPAVSCIVAGGPVPRPGGVRTPLERGTDPRSSGVELYEVEQDESPLSRAALERASTSAGTGERETEAAPPKRQPTTAQIAVRKAGVVSADEEDAFIAWVVKKYQVRGPGFWKTAAADIPELAAAWRADTAPADNGAGPEREPWCGACREESRHVEDDTGHRTICRTCHPNRKTAS